MKNIWTEKELKGLHLFTPVSEALPPFDVFVLTLNKAGKQSLLYLNKRFEWSNGSGYLNSGVTHWLDLSKLTTKKKAVKALEDALLSDHMTGTEIIESFEQNLL